MSASVSWCDIELQFERCYHRGNWVEGAQVLSVLLLLPAHESASISKLEV